MQMKQTKSAREEQVSKPSDVKAPTQPVPTQDEPSDPKAEAWAAKNTWFGQDRAMTYTAFEIHKDLVEKEGLTLNLMNIMQKLIKESVLTFRINLLKDVKQSTEPVQTVASVKRA